MINLEKTSTKILITGIRVEATVGARTYLFHRDDWNAARKTIRRRSVRPEKMRQAYLDTATVRLLLEHGLEQ